MRAGAGEQEPVQLGGVPKPVLFTLGDQSPPTFARVVNALSTAVAHAKVFTLPGAGHIPHTTHPEAYVEAIVQFTHAHGA